MDDQAETQSSKTTPDDWPQLERKHPPEWERDLNPEYMAGQNLGVPASEGEKNVRTAHDRKEVHVLLDRFRDDELKQIPIVPEGRRLRQGATYIDLGDTRPREFTALGGMEAGPGNYFVPKDEVPYILWNRLIGEEKPGQEHEGEKDAS